MATSKTIVRKILTGVFAGSLTFAASAQSLQKLVDADNGFAFDLLKQITEGQPNDNIFISPFSAATALQMVANGAVGETKMEMQNVLKTGGLQPAELNAACKDLSQSLNSQTNVILDLANGIWYRKDLLLIPKFVSDSKDYFQAEQLAGVDFGSPKSADIVNEWANRKTRGKIQNVVAFPFPPATAVVLANAVYFKGRWAEPFDKSKTTPRGFHLFNGGTKQMPMMSQRRTFKYQEGNGFQAVQLPYAGDRLQMVLFLPATNSSPQKLLADFSVRNWSDRILPQFADREGFLAFPKFKISYGIVLNKPLQKLGMRLAFNHKAAGFLAMAADPELAVEEVTQKSFVAVDEEGTEAAAVTTVMMTDSLAPLRPPRPFEMIVDRPFFFVTTDSQTQTILFMGIVSDPAE